MTGAHGATGVAATRGRGFGRGSFGSSRIGIGRGRSLYGSPGPSGRQNTPLGSGRRTRGSRSVLPFWFPRKPLQDITTIVQEMFLAGTDTTSAALQWILAEIINHPNAFKKLRDEIMAVVGPNRPVEESDIPNLPYLQAIVKEGLRLHPPLPLILRKCKEDCKINGYDVLANSRLMINVHAIMRDPESWKNPMEFVPDRFLASTIENSTQHDQANSKGQNIHYLPFGSGRRACPGAGLASTVIHVTIAKLVQCFDLETKDGEKVDMEVGSGISAGMAHPLVCYPVVLCRSLTNLAK